MTAAAVPPRVRSHPAPTCLPRPPELARIAGLDRRRPPTHREPSTMRRRTFLLTGTRRPLCFRRARPPAGAGRDAEGRRLRRLLQGVLRQAHLPGLHQGHRHRGRVGRRADRRGLAGAARAGGQGRPGAGRRLDDVAGRACCKGQATELWAPLDESKIANLGNLLPRFVNNYPDGRVAGIGAVAWYITLVTNTEVYPGGADLVGRRCGTRPTRTSSACSRWSPTRSCSK